MTSNDRGSKGAGLNHLVFSGGGLLEFFVLVIFSPSSNIHQSQTEEGVEDGGTLSHTFLAKKASQALTHAVDGAEIRWSPVEMANFNIIYKVLYILPVPCLDFRGYLKLIFRGFNNPRT